MLRNSPFTADRDGLFKFLFLLVIGFFFVEIAYYVVFLDSWFDEANYAYKGWLSAKELAYPFIDFRVKYPPVGFYAQHFFQYVFGPTILGARMFSALLLVGVAGLIYKLCKKIGNRWTGLIGLSLLAFHPYLVGYYVSTPPYALSVFFPLLAIFIFEYGRFSEKPRVILSSAIMTLSVLVRYNMLPILAVFTLYIFLRTKNWKAFLLSLLISGAVFLTAMIPYFRLDAEYALIWASYMFGPFASLLPFEYFSLFPTSSEGVFASFLGSFLNSDYLKFLMTIAVKFFHLWAILGAALIFSLFVPKEKLRIFFKEDRVIALFIVLTIVQFLAHFIAGVGLTTYLKMLYVAPFLIIAVAGLLHLFYRHANAHGVWEAIRVPACSLFAAVLLLSSISVALATPNIVFFNHFDYADTDLSRAMRGGQYLRLMTEPEDVILILDGDSIHHVLLAGRYVIPPLANGEFTYVPDERNDLLNRYRLYNIPILMSWLRETADVVVFQRGRLEGENVMIKSDSPQSITEFREIIDTSFELVGSIEGVYLRKYTIDSGMMDIYRRITTHSKNSQ